MENKLALAIAKRYVDAEQNRAPLEPLSAQYPDLAEADCYQIQDAVVAAKVARGEKIVGVKIGATSAVIQQKFGLTEPIYGTIFASQHAQNGGTVEMARLVHPRAECETAFVLGKDLQGPDVTAADALAATEAICAAFEINDPRTRDWQMGMREIIADNGSSARFVLGERVNPRALDLTNIAVALKKNGAPAAEGKSSAVMGNPANAVAWLANKLAARGRRLRAGDIILPGSLTPLVPVATGDWLEAKFDALGIISIRFV